MKYIVEIGRDEIMFTSQELKVYANKLWEKHQQMLVLEEVSHDTMYFSIIDAEEAERLIFLTSSSNICFAHTAPGRILVRILIQKKFEKVLTGSSSSTII